MSRCWLVNLFYLNSVLVKCRINNWVAKLVSKTFVTVTVIRSVSHTLKLWMRRVTHYPRRRQGDLLATRDVEGLAGRSWVWCRWWGVWWVSWCCLGWSWISVVSWSAWAADWGTWRRNLCARPPMTYCWGARDDKPRPTPAAVAAVRLSYLDSCTSCMR